MRYVNKICFVILALVAVLALAAGPASAAYSLKGQVLGGGAPVANSAVTLWAGTTGAPKQLAQARTGAELSAISVGR